MTLRSESPAAALDPDPPRIVIRGVNWLGDAVMSLPAVQRLRQRYPRSQIDVFTPAKLAEVWECCPFVDAVVPFEPRNGLRAAARLLRRGDYAVGLAFPNSFRSALELWLAGIRVRVGFERPVRSWLLTRPVMEPAGSVRMVKLTDAEVRRRTTLDRFRAPPPPERAHHVYRYLDLVAAIGASGGPSVPSLQPRADEVRAVCESFGLASARGASPTPLIGLNAGAEYGPAKRWPISHWIEAAQRVSAQRACRWVVLGGPADREAAELIGTGLQGQATVVAGRTGLRQLIHLLNACRVVVSNDTGPMHLAAAAGTRVVALFGSTSPELTGPGAPGDRRHRVLRCEPPAACAPCFRRECPIDHRCLLGLSPERVASEILALLDAPPE